MGIAGLPDRNTLSILDICPWWPESNGLYEMGIGSKRVQEWSHGCEPADLPRQTLRMRAGLWRMAGCWAGPATHSTPLCGQAQKLGWGMMN